MGPEGASLTAGEALGSDTAATLLSELSQGDMERLVQILDPVPSPGARQQADDLLHALRGAATTLDAERASSLIRQLAALDSRLVEPLPVDPQLTALHKVVEQTVRQLTAAARVDAEKELSAAAVHAQLASAPLPGWDADKAILLALCEQLFVGGGMRNYEKTVRLASTLRMGEASMFKREFGGRTRRGVSVTAQSPRVVIAAVLCVLLAALLVYLFR